MTTNRRTEAKNGTKPNDSPGDFMNLGNDVLDGCEAELEQAINKSLAILEAEVKFGSPGAVGIEVRHESNFQGLFQRENPEDRERADALKANRDRGYLTADQLKVLGAYAAKGQQYVMDVVARLAADTAARPVELQPVAQLLTRVGTQVITKQYLESLKFLAEMGSLEITQATIPGKKHRK